MTHIEDVLKDLLRQLTDARDEIEKLKRPMDVEVGDLVQIVGYGEVCFGKLAWFYGDVPHYMQVTRLCKQGSIRCAEVKQPTDLNGTTWTVPISSIVEVKRQTPKVGTYDSEGKVYRASGWEPTSRKLGDRRRKTANPRGIALAALEAIPHPSMNEWQTAINIARNLRGVDKLVKIQTRSGKDRRATSKGVDSEA